MSGGYGWPRLPVEQSAPSEHPGSNPGAPTKHGKRTDLCGCAKGCDGVFGPDGFGRTFHATADEELDRVLDLYEAFATQGGPEFVAQNAMSVSEAVS